MTDLDFIKSEFFWGGGFVPHRQPRKDTLLCRDMLFTSVSESYVAVMPKATIKTSN